VRVIAPFDGLPIVFADATVIPRQRGGRFEFVVQRPFERDTTLAVTGVIGGGHMAGGGTQGFVTDLPDGTVRFLPFDWSRQTRTWFCNTGTRTNAGWQPITRAMRLADCGDWPPSRILGDTPRFSNCQSCHGSGIDVSFDSTKQRWQTRVATYAIDCESCHGPAARHVSLMNAGSPAADIGLEPLATRDKDRAIGTCMGCHALKTRIAPGYAPGARLTDYYAVQLSHLGDAPFTPDGRTRTFAYQEGHYASDCYRNGGMTCTSCHDPHSQGYRTVDGQPIPGRVDDRQCTSCHASKRDDISAHTKHPAASTGSRCVSCHMPYEQQHELGKVIRYARSDHSIAIPRPALDSSLGLVGACRGCHTDRTTAALDAQVTQWWGTLKPHEGAVAGLLQARTVTTLAEASPLLLQPNSRHAMAQAIGLATWLERFARPALSDVPGSLDRALRGLADSPDPDVQALALAALHYARRDASGVRAFLSERVARSPDPSGLRRRWAVVLGSLGDAARERGRFDDAVAAYRAGLEVIPGHAPLLVNLGLALAARGDLTGAVTAYRQSLQADPAQPLTAVNLGVALEQGNDAAGARAAYERAIAIDPTSALAYLNLGTSLLREDRAADAGPWLERALARDPGLATGHFQLALVRLKAGDLHAAQASVRRALALDTTNADARKLAEALAEALRDGQRQ
jgi:tetratricopeptide (TPR) repeat protein/5-methylcytosine-specific restriction endonuclease McrA